MELIEPQPKRRVMDRSSADARRAIADTLGRFGAWRLDLARIGANVERRFSETDRRGMLERCAAIEGELLAAREDLILGLAEAPQKVAGNSRVVDVERALDDVERAVGAVRARLG